MSTPQTLAFQKECFARYLDDIRLAVPEIPDPYVYPDGNHIRPVVPTITVQNSIMLIGAFPSARFERRSVETGRRGLLIPVGDNLSPFGREEYFDGEGVRIQASRDSLDRNYFPQLGIDPDKIWITDMVKVYLYPKKHIDNCTAVAPGIRFENTHKLFEKIALASMEWMKREIELCNPRLIITLGEIPARVITGDNRTPSKQLLDGSVRDLNLDSPYKITHLGHPEIRRINNEWDILTEKAIRRLAVHIKELV